MVIIVVFFLSLLWNNNKAGLRPFYKNGRSPALFFLCFGRGMSVARRDHGGGLALPESCRGYCRSRYDAEITRNRQWRQRITEDLLDASKMYDWNDLKLKRGTCLINKAIVKTLIPSPIFLFLFLCLKYPVQNKT